MKNVIAAAFTVATLTAGITMLARADVTRLVTTSDAVPVALDGKTVRPALAAFGH